MTVDDVEVYREFFFAFDEHSLSDEFRHARDEMYSRLTLEMKQMMEKHWRLLVSFFMTTGRRGPDLSVAYLQSSLALVKAVTEKTNQERVRDDGEDSDCTDQRRYRFPYSDLRAELSVSSFKLEQGAVPVLTELLALGVGGLGNIDVGANSALGRLPITELGPILHAVTDGSSFRALEGYEKILRGERRELRLQNWTPNGAWYTRQLEAVCSSLAVCKDLQRLHLSHLGRGGDESPSCESRRKKVLQWLAFALFSKESRTSFATLTIEDADF